MSRAESDSTDRALPAPRTDHSILTTVVPALYVDIIARLIPGVVILTMLVIAAFGWSRVQTWLSEIKDVPDIFKIGLFVTFAHVVGLLAATPLSFALRKRRGGERRGAAPTTPEALTGPEEARRFDFVKYIDPDAGHRISKLRAEAQLGMAICVGCIATLIVVIVRVPLEGVFDWGLAATAVLGMGASIASTTHARRANRRAIFNASELHGFDRCAPPAWVDQEKRVTPALVSASTRAIQPESTT